MKTYCDFIETPYGIYCSTKTMIGIEMYGLLSTLQDEILHQIWKKKIN